MIYKPLFRFILSRKFIKRLYPNSQYAVEDLERAAKLAEEKLKDIPKTIEIYEILTQKKTREKDIKKLKEKIKKLKEK